MRGVQICGIVCVVIGVLIAIAGILVGVIASPNLVNNALESSLIISSAADEDYATFVVSDSPFVFSFTFYNLTNKAEVLAGSKASYTKVGPYAYDMWGGKLNVAFSDDGSTVSYDSYSYFTFDADNTGDGLAETDMMTNFNTPYLLSVDVVKAAGEVYFPYLLSTTLVSTFINSTSANNVLNLAAGTLYFEEIKNTLIALSAQTGITSEAVFYASLYAASPFNGAFNATNQDTYLFGVGITKNLGPDLGDNTILSFLYNASIPCSFSYVGTGSWNLYVTYSIAAQAGDTTSTSALQSTLVTCLASQLSVSAAEAGGFFSDLMTGISSYGYAGGAILAVTDSTSYPSAAVRQMVTAAPLKGKSAAPLLSLSYNAEVMTALGSSVTFTSFEPFFWAEVNNQTAFQDYATYTSNPYIDFEQPQSMWFNSTVMLGLVANCATSPSVFCTYYSPTGYLLSALASPLFTKAGSDLGMNPYAGDLLIVTRSIGDWTLSDTVDEFFRYLGEELNTAVMYSLNYTLADLEEDLAEGDNKTTVVYTGLTDFNDDYGVYILNGGDVIYEGSDSPVTGLPMTWATTTPNVGIRSFTTTSWGPNNVKDEIDITVWQSEFGRNVTYSYVEDYKADGILSLKKYAPSSLWGVNTNYYQEYEGIMDLMVVFGAPGWMSQPDFYGVDATFVAEKVTPYLTITNGEPDAENDQYWVGLHPLSGAPIDIHMNLMVSLPLSKSTLNYFSASVASNFGADVRYPVFSFTAGLSPADFSTSVDTLKAADTLAVVLFVVPIVVGCAVGVCLIIAGLLMVCCAKKSSVV